MLISHQSEILHSLIFISHSLYSGSLVQVFYTDWLDITTMLTCITLVSSFDWSLVRVTFGVAFGFLAPKFWEVAETYELFFCHFMNAGSVMGIPWGGGDTQIIPYAKEFIWTYCTQRWWGWKNLCSRPRATLWNFHYLIFKISF